MGAAVRKIRSKTCDIVVVGAGINGLVQAILLAQIGLNVQILDRQEKPENLQKLPKMGGWVSALNHASKRVLEKVGVWQTLCREQMVAPYYSMEVKKEGHNSGLCLNKEAVMSVDLGAIVCNSALRKSLWRQLESYEGEINFSRADCEKIDTKKGEVVTKDGQRWRAAWIIGADGARSWVREQAGLESTRDSLHTQQAKVGVVQHRCWHNGQAKQCFTQQGIVALLPLHTMTESGMVWSMHQKHQQEDPLNRIDKLFPEIEVEKRCGGVWHTHNIISQQAERFYQDQVLLVGDSAVSVHPLAGQGLNIGIQCAGRLAAILKKARISGEDLANLYWAKQYQAEVFGYCAATRRFITLCETIMAPQSNWGSLGQSALKAADTLPWVKKQLIQHALNGIEKI